MLVPVEDKPTWQHDCDKCRFLGCTIGGGRMVDCYVCNEDYARKQGRAPTIVARFSDEGRDYYSSTFDYIHPGGHSELWAAKALYQLVFIGDTWWGDED
jgi:hypothetical protein